MLYTKIFQVNKIAFLGTVACNRLAYPAKWIAVIPLP